MYLSRIVNRWRLVTLSFAAVALALGSGFTATAVRADDLPFWEKADLVAKQANLGAKPSQTYKKTASKKASKSYASNSGSKKKYAAKSSKKLGGEAEASEPVKKKHKGVKVAALGNTYVPAESKVKKSLSGGSVDWTASSGCLDSGLKAIIYEVASNYGPLRVNSTCRSRGHNASVGGAPKSKHLSGDAVDFRVFGNTGAVYAFLKSNGGVGGLKHYGGGLFHIDNGDRRSW
jgi:Peptidase M15